MQSKRGPYSKVAVVSFIWVLLTTPLTTLGLLQLIAKTGNPIASWMTRLPPGVALAIEGFILIVPPLVGVVLGAMALRSVISSWRPINGVGYARWGLALGSLSTLLAMAIFVSAFFEK